MSRRDKPAVYGHEKTRPSGRGHSVPTRIRQFNQISSRFRVLQSVADHDWNYKAEPEKKFSSMGGGDHAED
jgi:hypothetical protein